MSKVRLGKQIKEKTLILISDYAADYAGNFIRSLLRLAEAYGGDVAYVFPEKATGKNWINLLPGENVRFVSFERIRFGASCEKILAEFGSECLVHVHFCNDVRLLEIKKRFCHVICHVHMANEVPARLRSCIRKMLERPLRNLLYGRMCRDIKFVGVSQPVVDSLVRRYPGLDVVCVRNAVDFSRYQGVVVSERPLAEDRLSALVFGTHFWRKAVDVAMESCKRLRSAGIKAELVVSAHSVEKCARSAESCGGVPFWMRIIPVTDDVGMLYAQADCFLSPSRSEAFGYAVVEAAYMGCRVIASDVPGQNSLKDIPGIAWVPAGDSAALAEAIAESGDWLRSRSEADLRELRAYLEGHYGIERWVNNMLEVYEGIVS